jgi:hypothetical protein
MAIDTLQTLEVIEALENFISKIRPPEHIREKLDVSYEIEGLSIIIFEIRPQWDKPEIIHQYPVARTTFVKTKNHWKVFWRRADSKWHSYSPRPFVNTIQEFTKLVEEDQLHCFWR